MGTLRLAAEHRGGQIVVTIEDDGAGMDPANLRKKAVEKRVISREEAETLGESASFELIFRPGFSTAATVSDVSGRGVGMDVVKSAISRLKGSIHLASSLGRGSTVELRLPLTLAITQVLTARVGGELVAVPLDAVVSAQAVDVRELEPVADGTCLRVAGELIPIVRAHQSARPRSRRDARRRPASRRHRGRGRQRAARAFGGAGARPPRGSDQEPRAAAGCSPLRSWGDSDRRPRAARARPCRRRDESTKRPRASRKCRSAPSSPRAGARGSWSRKTAR